jgi:hypothetical protein
LVGTDRPAAVYAGTSINESYEAALCVRLLKGVFMRTVGLLGAAVAVCLSLVFAATAAASGTAVQFSATGPGAEALFSTFPASGNPVPGTVYTDTYVNASSTITGIGNGKSLDQVLYLDEFSYKFDTSLNFIPVSDTNGYADGAAVTLSISPKLTSARASATVPLTTCALDANGNPTICNSAVQTAVSGSWTGQGSLVKQSSLSLFHTKGTTIVSRFRGSTRNATAALAVGGTSIAAPLVFADIFDATQKTTCISHTGGCKGP